MADHALHAGIDEALGHRGGGARVGLVVLGHELEADLLATQHDTLGVGVVEGQLGAVLLVLAQVRDRPGERPGKAELDHHVGHRPGRAGGDVSGGVAPPIAPTAAATCPP